MKNIVSILISRTLFHRTHLNSAEACVMLRLTSHLRCGYTRMLAILQSPHIPRYRYFFNGQEADNEVYGNEVVLGYEFRQYDARIGRWWSIDPKANEYPGVSPYAFCNGNPIALMDPSGAETSPIYDLQGNFLGTDDEGLKGRAIMMKREHFSQNMEHNTAVAIGEMDMSIYNVTYEAKSRVFLHQSSLSKRPDWDGIVTREEGIKWAKSHVNALSKPTAENTLYIDASKLDFGTITIKDFENGIGGISPVNLLSMSNSRASLNNKNLFNTIYALGRVDIKLLDSHGHVQIINNDATDYDWNTGGGWFRDKLIRVERFLNDLGDQHGFKTYYYGTGKLNE